MNIILNLRLYLISISLILSINTAAQPGLTIYTDMGSNNVSHGLFIKSTLLGQYKYRKNSVETGFQTDLKNYNRHFLSGYTIDVSRDFEIKGISLVVNGFYITTNFYGILRESNMGGLLKMKFNHFEMAFGTNFRTFTLRPGGITDYKNEKNNVKIREINNLMYLFNYNLKPADSFWNVGLSVTNFDHFTINQETNPMFNLHASYKLNLPVCLFAEAWYKIAGASNLEVNYFGFYIRTGIIWNIN
jgi:hypothetical protein